MAQVVVEMSGDEAKLFRAYQKIIDQAAKLEGKQKDLAKTTQQAGAQAEQSFGSTASAAIGKYAAGMVSLQAAAQAFGAAMAYSKANVDAAIQSVERLITTRQQLLQVSGSATDNQRANDFAERLANRGISRDSAQQIVFQAASSGFMGQEDSVARLVAANQFSVGSAVNAAGRVRQMFGEQNVTAMGALAGVREAARISNLDIDPYMAMLPHMATAQQMAGGRPSEAMAALAVTATYSNRAAEYVSTMSGQLNLQKGFQGLGIMGQVSKLMEMPAAKRQQILGNSKEANQAYTWLAANKDVIASRTADIQAAIDDPSSFVSRMEGLAFDPTTEQGRINIGRRESIIAANQLERSREGRLAEGGYQRRSVVTREMQRDEEGRAGPIGQFLSSKAMTWAETAGAPEMVIEGAGRVARSAGPALLERAAMMLMDAGERLIRGSDASTRQRASAAQQPE